VLHLSGLKYDTINVAVFASGFHRVATTALVAALTLPVSVAVAGDRKLQRAVESELSTGGLRGSVVSILVADLATGEIVYERRADELLIPASVTKIVTAASALGLLEPQYRFRSGLYGDGRKDKGTYHGDVYLKAWGDPVLVDERVWLLVRDLRRSGVRKIAGDLIVDDTFFDDVRFGYDWGNRTRAWYHAPHGAVSVNFNTIRSRGRNLAIKGDPSQNAGASFADMMAREGIVLDGRVRTGGSVPEGSRALAEASSKPLAAIVADLNKHSNNFVAEQILKTIGAEIAGPPGTAEKGLEAVSDFLEEIGLSAGDYDLHDGSGLSRSNRISARSVVRVLDHMARDFELGPEFIQSLKVAGAEGSKSRFGDELCRRRLRVKTGHLFRVNALAGYAWTTSGRQLAFAILANEYRRGRWAADRSLERICHAFLDDGPPSSEARRIASPLGLGAGPADLLSGAVSSDAQGD